jgi:hypothetical protein
MPAHKRTPIQVERDRVEIARLYLQGTPQAVIAEQLGVSQSQISYDLSVIQARWQEATKVTLDAAKARELAKIDELEREYWAAWESSKKAKERTETEKRNAEDGSQMRAKVEKKEQDADPRFLDGVGWCINRRCQLLGLDAPKSIHVDEPIRIIMDGTDTGDPDAKTL